MGLLLRVKRSRLDFVFFHILVPKGEDVVKQSTFFQTRSSLWSGRNHYVGRGFTITSRYCTLTPPIQTSFISPCTYNTKCLYSPHGRNNGQEPYRGLGPELKESPSKEDKRSSITGSPAKLTDGPKY
ncbi:hypothetical protein AYI68_g6292 [Smittium mucronatum]|uniref:Uncharacterized protein n=1 Tax=Smittium mucronatum TaxID=133383 RepID=A0A1R0GRV5_9FUNG|nr:hypothetical protein AYI68_g6292 [Smittium mucronatum]